MCCIQTQVLFTVVTYIQVKVTPYHAYAGTVGIWRYSTYPFSPCSSHLIPSTDPVPNVHEAWWALGSIWRAWEISLHQDSIPSPSSLKAVY